MFHKVSIIINGIALVFCTINYYSVFITNYCYLDTKCLLIFLALFTSFVFTSFLFLFITSLITNVKVGKPPLSRLVIAYKYGLSNTVTKSNIFNDMKIFPERDTVQICYENRHGPFGIAHGAVIQDDSVDLHGYNLFHTKEIPHALYICCPTLPWLSHFGVWLVLRIVYPKLYKYSKRNRLSAYPVVELYKRFSVVLMAPLSRQDYFVVPEAAHSLQRSSSCFDSSMSTTTNISPSKSLTASILNNSVISKTSTKMLNGSTKTF